MRIVVGSVEIQELKCRYLLYLSIFKIVQKNWQRVPKYLNSWPALSGRLHSYQELTRIDFVLVWKFWPVPSKVELKHPKDYVPATSCYVRYRRTFSSLRVDQFYSQFSRSLPSAVSRLIKPIPSRDAGIRGVGGTWNPDATIASKHFVWWLQLQQELVVFIGTHRTATVSSRTIPPMGQKFTPALKCAPPISVTRF
jgi:hypothetical protein